MCRCGFHGNQPEAAVVASVMSNLAPSGFSGPNTVAGGRRRARVRALSGTVTLVILGASACSAGTPTGASSSGNSARRNEQGLATGSGSMVGSGWDCPGGSCEWLDAESSPPGGPREVGSTPPSTASFAVPGLGDDTGPWQAVVIDDNTDGSRYRAYLESLPTGDARYRLASWDRPAQTFRVANSAGKPVSGAIIEIVDQRGDIAATRRTHADGIAEWAAPQGTGPFTVRVRKGLASVEQPLDVRRPDTAVTLDALTGAEALNVDVLFLIDATASMADALTQVGADMTAIAAGVATIPGKPVVRYALTVYRDQDEAFLTRTFNFTAEGGRFERALSEVRASGGGDTPEAFDIGLRDALAKPAWGSDGTIRLVVAIGDAPPRIDGGETLDALEGALESASQQGVSIFGIAAPGADGATVATLRQVARRTRGSFAGVVGPRSGPSASVAAPGSPEAPRPVASIVVAHITERVAALQGE